MILTPSGLRANFGLPMRGKGLAVTLYAWRRRTDLVSRPPTGIAF